MGEYLRDNIYIENADELTKLKYSDNAGRPIFESVRVTKKDFSVFELFRKYKNGKLILDVDFQRGFVWKSKQQSELLESILMGLPLPIFYFKLQDDSTYVVVDGKQRLSALFAFLDNQFALKNLKILTFLNGKKYMDLEWKYGIYQSQLEDYQIYSHVILPPTPDKIIFDIFDRVNRGGTKLNKQEIRNALYHGQGLDMMNDITLTMEFQKATRIDSRRDRRMKGAYLLTRFFAFFLLYNNYLGSDCRYDGDIDGLIEKTLVYMNQCGHFINTLREIAMDSLRKAYLLLGNGCFRKGLNASNPINMNIFETCMYLMTLVEDNNLTIEMKNSFYQAITSEIFLDCIGDSRDSVYKVDVRFRMMDEIAKEIKNDF